MLMIGTSDGAITIYNPTQEIFVEDGRRAVVSSGGQIAAIQASKKEVVLCSSKGAIVHYKILNSLFP